MCKPWSIPFLINVFPALTGSQFYFHFLAYGFNLMDEFENEKVGWKVSKQWSLAHFYGYYNGGTQNSSK